MLFLCCAAEWKQRMVDLGGLRAVTIALRAFDAVDLVQYHGVGVLRNLVCASCGAFACVG